MRDSCRFSNGLLVKIGKDMQAWYGGEGGIRTHVQPFGP
jgi:hypothetical protein